MRPRTLLVVFVLVIGATVAALAQTSEAHSKKADIIRLLRMTGAAQGGAQAFDMMFPSLKQAMPQVPEQVWREFRSEIREDDMIELTYAIWDKHFTHQEVRELLNFYQTPIGQKIIRETPAIQQESMVAGEKWGNQIVSRIFARLKEKGYQPPPGFEQP